MDVQVSQKDVLALLGQFAVEKLVVQLQLDAARQDVNRLTIALEKAEKPNG
jgi:hypothetical protein